MSISDDELLAQALTVCNAITASMNEQLMAGAISPAAAFAGIRFAGLRLQASAEQSGLDVTDVERALDLLVASLEAIAIPKRDMQ